MTIKAYYRLNGNSNDASGNGFNGIDTAITYSQNNGRLNQGAGFNGSSSKITLADNLTSLMPAAAYTASIWMKSTSTPSGTNNYYLFSSFYNSPQSKGFLLLIQGTTGHFYLDSFKSGVEYYVGGVINVCDGKWHYLVAVFDGVNTAKTYIDAKLIASKTTFQIQDYNPTNKINIGCYYYSSLGFIQFFNGSIDEFIFENSAWSDAKIKNEYSRIKGFF